MLRHLISPSQDAYSPMTLATGSLSFILQWLRWLDYNVSDRVYAKAAASSRRFSHTFCLQAASEDVHLCCRRARAAADRPVEQPCTPEQMWSGMLDINQKSSRDGTTSNPDREGPSSLDGSWHPGSSNSGPVSIGDCPHTSASHDLPPSL